MTSITQDSQSVRVYSAERLVKWSNLTTMQLRRRFGVADLVPRLKSSRMLSRFTDTNLSIGVKHAVTLHKPREEQIRANKMVEVRQNLGCMEMSSIFARLFFFLE